ncbi:hypothetical protein [Emticicia fontis]
MANKKQSSSSVASLAAKVLSKSGSSDIAKSLAGSALSQFKSGNQTGAKIESVASKALSSMKYSSQTKKLAGSVLSQSDKKR